MADRPRTDKSRLEEELTRFAGEEVIHDLPPIYDLWSGRYLAPRLSELGYASLQDFYVTNIARAARRIPRTPVHVVSLGAGNCDLEVAMAAELKEQLSGAFSVTCVELNPVMVDRGIELAREAGVDDVMFFAVDDLNTWTPSAKAHVAIASHSLHHVVELEHLFEVVRQALVPGGALLVNDMIGRNGHLRWPEAEEILRPIWAAMPERYKRNRVLQRTELEFENWDCSSEGFEGIRSQDILPLLLQQFYFEEFLGFMNVLGPFIDNRFGRNFDIQRQEDVDFFLRVAALDDLLIDLGVVTPTQMIGVLRVEPMQTVRCHRHWTPEFCVRPVAL